MCDVTTQTEMPSEVNKQQIYFYRLLVLLGSIGTFSIKTIFFKKGNLPVLYTLYNQKIYKKNLVTKNFRFIVQIKIRKIIAIL